ncbi:MAG TPA: gamma-glutamyl-gamma-aminobutyrate hydrolase family protein [Chthonomonadales bacterium]|nr:gamma-glutamyl-gamma-aminobutyrate hydrolase family protein [Chthonomonadales bacterium]
MSPVAYVILAYPEEWPGLSGHFARHGLRFEQASGGRPCVLVPFLHTSAVLPRLDPCAVVLSGFSRSFETFEPADLRPVGEYVLERPDIPVLGLCGGHQLLAHIFEGGVDGVQRLYDQPMRRRRPGEPVERPDYHPEFFMETGFREISVVERDPLFSACPERPMLLESHYCEVKRLPEGFDLLASTTDCRIQAMRHRQRPVVGLQFHPEDYTERFPDGRLVLEAFFADVAGLTANRTGCPGTSEAH